MTPDTIKQRSITVPTAGGDVVVRRMRWKAAREFMLALAGQIGAVGLIEKARAAEVALSAEFLLGKIGELIKGTESLVAMLVCNTTTLTSEQVDQLDLLELSEIIEAAIALNLGDELKNCWAGIAQRIKALVGGDGSDASASMPTPSSADSMPTSSMPDTAPTT